VNCVTDVTMAKRRKRAGKTEVFSVSVEPGTRKLLRSYAKRKFGGNVSLLIAELIREAAAQAKRQEAAARYLRSVGFPEWTEEDADRFDAEIQEELRQDAERWARRRRRGAA
jgi:hypothetical protein